MGKISAPSAAEVRACSSVCKKLANRYSDNWRVNVRDREGGLTVNVIIRKRHALHAEIASVDWFGFDRRLGSPKEIAEMVAEEVDAVLAKIEARPVFKVVWSSDGNGNVTHYA